MSGKYDDIIALPHHVSSTRPQMPAINRAAQFAPFAALTGYDAAVKETARLTSPRLELDEHEKLALNEKLMLLLERSGEAPVAEIRYFIPDGRKAGGAYITVSGAVKKLDEYERLVIMGDGKKIPIDEIAEIESDIFGGAWQSSL